jgi:YidC/Oxa1 family membrane protein insertase
VYDVVPNYGVAIVVVTALLRLVLIPLGVKQLHSMQAMQAIQPKIREIQKKYRNNRQKAQEETMKVYREHGVNPLGGCLPTLLLFPFLIAMYSVIRPPSYIPTTTGENTPAYEIHNNHLPEDSALLESVVRHRDLDFLWMNLQCTPLQSGGEARLRDTKGEPIQAGRVVLGEAGDPLPFEAAAVGIQDCGDGVPVRIPYFAFLALMIGTTFYQQRQMQRVSPPGAQNPQQQLLLKIMPVTFGIFGVAFPAGLLVYWSTANVWQIGQQAVMIRLGHIGPAAVERRKQELAAKPKRTGLMARMLEQAEEDRERRMREAGTMRKPGSGKKGRPGGPKPGQRKKKPGGSGGSGSGKDRPKR